MPRRRNIDEDSSEEEYVSSRKPSSSKNKSISRSQSRQHLSQSSQSQRLSQSQSTQSQSSQSQQEPLNQTELHRLAALCANYFLVANCKKNPIKRADIGKLIPKEYSRRTADIIKVASTKLEKVFGYKVHEEKKGSFLLLNLIDLSAIFEGALPIPIQPHESSILVLRTNILIVILMNGGVLQESMLKEFLRKFGIDAESKDNHALLGNVQKLLYQDFVQQGYLEVIVHKDMEPPLKEIRWGNRAKAELNKKELIQFVCKIYGEGFKPEMWVEQWKLATLEEAEENNI